MNRILTYVLVDILRNKIVLVYTAMLALFAWSSFSLEDNAAKGLLTLLNIILLTVPLVSILFSTIYIYNSSEFIELLASHPIRRGKIWWSLFLGLAGSLGLAFLVGAGIPVVLFAEWQKAWVMLAVGLLLTVIFVALAFFSAVLCRDKARGIGLSLVSWLYFSVIFDALVLFLLFQFADYPIEKMMVVVTAFSPIDLGRILILLQLDVSAMMGYTGAIFKEFFGTRLGMLLSFGLLLCWIVVPFSISLRKFIHKDL